MDGVRAWWDAAEDRWSARAPRPPFPSRIHLAAAPRPLPPTQAAACLLEATHVNVAMEV